MIVDEGDPYSALLVNKSINKLKARGLFGNVEKKVNEGSSVDLKVLEPTLKKASSFGYLVKINENRYILSTCFNEIVSVFEEVIKTSDIKLAKNWIIVELFAVLNEKNIEIKDSPVTPKNLAILINQISSGNISGKIAKEVFEIMIKTGSSADKIIEGKGLQQQSNPEEIKKIIKKVLDKNSEKVLEYKSGKVKLFGFFIGEAMKISAGKANPKLVNEILKTELKK